MIWTPYTALRRPNSEAAVVAAASDPPPEMTPMKANWEPPVNISALSATACQTDSPAATAKAPNEMP